MPECIFGIIIQIYLQNKQYNYANFEKSNMISDHTHK